MFRKPVDILAVGDMTVDVFIKLKDAHIHCKVNHEDCEISMPFGEKIPYETTKVIFASGGAPNAAISFARLGLHAALVSDIGNDQNSNECLNKLHREKVVTTNVRVHRDKQTNCSFVLWYDDDRTILVNHISYEHDSAYLDPNQSKPPKWLYLTSLASQSPLYEKALTDFLDARPEVKLLFQPGTYQINRGADELTEIFSRTDVIVLNLEEAQTMLRVHDRDVKMLLGGLAKRGPKIVLITDGTDGAYMFDGDHHYHMPVYPDPRKAYERTGCGDAFASTFVSMLAIGRTPLEALTAAPVNAMSVAQFIGAHDGLLPLDQLDWFLKKALAEYRPREI